MRCALRLTIAALVVLALAPARAQELGRPPRGELGYACLDQNERRAAVEEGQVMRLAAAIYALKSRIPGILVRARLCHGAEGLVYVLTVLARDGKVVRLTVDAVKGTLVNGL